MINNFDIQDLDLDEFELKIEKELELQAQNYIDEGDAIDLDGIMGPSYGSQSEGSIEVVNRGGLRRVSIDFSGENFEVNQKEYEEIKQAVDDIIIGESNESVDDAIDRIAKYGSRAVKVVFSFARKFDLENDYQYNDLKELLNRLCLRDLKARDTIVAVLMGANSKPHIKLAMVAAGEVREKNAVKYICKTLEDRDLFDVAFDALLDIREVEAVTPMLDIIDKTEDKDEERRGYLLKRSEYFVDFGKCIIPEVMDKYNNCDPWNKPIFAKILGDFEEDIIPSLQEFMEKETDARKLDSLYRLLGKLKSDKAADILVEAYRRGQNKKSAIIGLGHVRSHSSIELQKEILREGKENSFILEEVIVSLAFAANVNNREEIVELLGRYLKSYDPRVRIHAVLAMARMGYDEYLDEYMECLSSQNVSERKTAERLIHKLKTVQITEMCKKCLDLPQSEAVNVLHTLTKRKIFEPRAGEYLAQLLEGSSYLLKIEIYNIIGNTANTKYEVLPPSILFDELEKSANNSEKAVLNEIIARMRKVKVLPGYIK